MKSLLFIALGGAGGAVARHFLASWALAIAPDNPKFPWGTLTVNLLGSFLIGVIFILVTEKTALGPEWRSILMVGFLGAFTTFSTFSLEVVVYLQEGYLLNAVIYMIASVLLCVVAAWAGIALTNSLVH